MELVSTGGFGEGATYGKGCALNSMGCAATNTKVYVCESHKIWEVDIQTGSKTVIAGDGTEGT